MVQKAKVKDLIKEFRALDACCVSDALDKIGIMGGLEGIRPVIPGSTLCGTAFIVHHVPCGIAKSAVGAGLNYVKDASIQGCFKVPTTLNTIGIDSENWEEIGCLEEFSKRQLELVDAYEKMGGICTNSCTPYLVGNIPLAGECGMGRVISSAIAFVNSVFGARTNSEGGPTALAAAVTGRVPAYGYHLDENRKAKYVVEVEMDLKTDLDYAMLGYYTGTTVGKEVPVFDGITRRPTLENLKALSAAIASSGAVALYHIAGVTPEAPTKEDILGENIKTIKFGPEQYAEIEKKFGYKGQVDFVVIGCPHCTINEIRKISELLNGKKIQSDMWICVARQIKDLSDTMGYTEIIEEAGAEFVCDTCPVLCPTLERGYKGLVTNSAKMAHYSRGLWNVKAALIGLEDCINSAVTGEWRGSIE